MTVQELYPLYLKHPSISTDTRKIKAGDIFFALKGPNFNGNEYVLQALEQGAGYAVAEEKTSTSDPRILNVENSLEMLQQLANHHRRQFSIPFLAITGSNGKTTTKELCHAVLSRKFRTYTTEGNLNNHIGIPLTLLKIKNDAELAVIEMGANHQHEIEFYCQIAEPTAGLITNIGRAHLEGFGGMKGIKKGKGELFDFLRSKNDSHVFVCSDFEDIMDISKGFASRQKTAYGLHERKGISARIKGTGHFTELDLMENEQVMAQVTSQLVGNYNSYNIMAAAAVGRYYDVPWPEIKLALESYSPGNSRSQWKEIAGNTYVLDSYNANPSSMQAAIDNFAALAVNDKILFLGAMKEMGEFAQREHQLLIETIGHHHWKEVVLVGDEFEKIEHPYIWFSTAKEAGIWWQKNAGTGNTILVKGSRGSAMEQMLPEEQ